MQKTEEVWILTKDKEPNKQNNREPNDDPSQPPHKNNPDERNNHCDRHESTTELKLFWGSYVREFLPFYDFFLL